MFACDSVIDKEMVTFTSVEIQCVSETRPIGGVARVEFSALHNGNRLRGEGSVQFSLINMPFACFIPGEGKMSPIGRNIESRVNARDSKKLGEVKHNIAVPLRGLKILNER